MDATSLYGALWWCELALGMLVMVLCVRHERRMAELHDRMRRPEHWRAIGRQLADEGRMEEAVRAWERMRGPITL